MAQALLTFAGHVHAGAVNVFKTTVAPTPGTGDGAVLIPGPAKVPEELTEGGAIILGAVLWVVFALGVLGLLRSAGEVQIAWKDGNALGVGIIIRLCGIIIAISAAPIVQFVA